MNPKLHTPEGAKDYLPIEEAFKIEIERKIENVFYKYGFLPISSPTFEHIEVFDGKGSVSSSQMYKFIDKDSSVLALRSDMTPAIARIAATAFEKKDIPLRFFYFENVFRYNEHYQGKLREFTQGGIELIGINSLEADAEAIVIAVNSLLASGLKDFKICIGQAEFFNAILEEANFELDICNKIKEFLIEKDYVAVQKITENSNINENLKKLFKDIPLLIGGVSILEKIEKLIKSQRAIDTIKSLKEIYDILKIYKLEKYISFDLSIARFKYYTGIIFRGYAEGTGFSIIDGGRYDKLIKNYGADYPSIGFAIKINNLLSALESQNINIKNEFADTLIAFSDEGKKTAIETGEELRKQGLNIENSLLDGDIEKNKEYAKNKNMGGMLYFINSENVKVFNFQNNSVSDVKISELLNREAK